jgi:D-alanyl-D-alanine carboxypeptidase
MIRPLLVVLVLALAAFTCAQPTAAGAAANRWVADLLEVHNARDVDALESFARERIGPGMLALLGGPERTAQQFATMYAGLGPLELVAQEGGGDVTLYTRGTLTGGSLAFHLTMEPGTERVTRLGFALGERPPGASRPPALDDDELAGAVDDYLSTLAAHDLFSGVALIARDGDPLYGGAFGRANLAGDPVSLDTAFPLASTSKMFTALAVLQLAEAGALGLDDTVADHLPAYPVPWARDVTIRQLLTHGSGLGGFDLAALRPLRTLAEMLALPVEPPAFAPGSGYRYSNVGYLLLGAIVEAASGLDFYAYLDAHVFGPAGMTHSGAPPLVGEPPGVATGFLAPLPDGRRPPNLDLRVHRGSPAADLVSTAPDLLRFGEALLAGDLLGEPWRSEAMSVQRPLYVRAGVSVGYGFGMTVRSRAGATSVGHAGGAPGAGASFELVPERGLTIVVLSNYDLIADVVAERLAEMVGDR